MPATFGRSHQVAVVGSAQTLLRDAWLELQHVDLISAAVTEALRGTSLSISDVDFVIDAGSDVLDGRSISNCGFLGASGAHHKEESRVEDDGLWAAMYAAAKIRGGGGGVGLVIAHSKPSESELRAFSSTLCEPFYQRPVGLDHISAAGLQAHQYATRTGVAGDAFARVAAHAWQGAAANPQVETLEVPTLHDISGAETVASPLRAYELRARGTARWRCCWPTRRSRAARRRARCGSPAWARPPTSTCSPLGSQALCRHAARRRPRPTLAPASPTPPASDVAEVSANSAAGELMVLEALGLAATGRGDRALRGRRVRRAQPLRRRAAGRPGHGHRARAARRSRPAAHRSASTTPWTGPVARWSMAPPASACRTTVS